MRPPVEAVGSAEGEVGGATLVGVALAGLVLVVGVVAVDVAALVGTRAAVQTAADLAALAVLTPSGDSVGAPAGGGEARAAEIAAANGAQLVACDCSAAQAIVAVRRRVRLLPGAVTVTLTARARAVLGDHRSGGPVG
jgi:hypothetical protein